MGCGSTWNICIRCNAFPMEKMFGLFLIWTHFPWRDLKNRALEEFTDGKSVWIFPTDYSISLENWVEYIANVKSEPSFPFVPNPSQHVHFFLYRFFQWLRVHSHFFLHEEIACYVFAQLVFNCQKLFDLKCCYIRGKWIVRFHAIREQHAGFLFSIGRFS